MYKLAVAKKIRKLLGNIVQNKEIIIVAGNLNEDLLSKSLKETYVTNKAKACPTAATLQHINLVDTHGAYATNNPEKMWASNGVQKRLDYVFTDTVTASLVTNIGVINVNKSFSTDHKAVIWKKEVEIDRLTDEAQRKSIDNSNDDLNQMWLIIKETVLQAAECLPKRKKECINHKLVKIVANIIKLIRVNNADMHDNNVMQLLAKWKQLKPEAVNAYLMTLPKDKLIIELLNTPKEWRVAQVILIPKPKEWSGNIDITRPITLIESTRKILTKILTARISKACELHNVLKGYNTSVLKNISTAVPIHVINAVAEHAREFDKKAWFTFQDMKKAYDSVRWKPMEAALKRIKMNNRFTELFGLMHNNRSNKIITEFGLSDKYQVQDELDQGKQAHPLCEEFSMTPYCANWARKWTSKISATVKKKAKLSVDFPASAMHYLSLYNLFKIDNIQVKSKITDLLVRLNSADIAGMTTKIRLINLQAQRWKEIEISTDGSLVKADSEEARGAAVFITHGIETKFGIAVDGTLSSTKAEAKAVLLALEAVPYRCKLTINTDSQAHKTSNWHTWNAIRAIIREKRIDLNMNKVAAHAGILENEKADKLAKGSTTLDTVRWAYNAKETAYIPVCGEVELDLNIRQFLNKQASLQSALDWISNNKVQETIGSLDQDID
ncbi:hypothetical protein G9A89_009489 [Geosiphon pyriformis]|nr:hypothetical protein G9A89_009489 [Geosiphon pyriformis]